MAQGAEGADAGFGDREEKYAGRGNTLAQSEFEQLRKGGSDPAPD